MSRAREAPLDYAGLADYLRALGYPARLELLNLLRFPHPIGELRLSPLRGSDGAVAKSAARQTIQAHLDKLVQADLVKAERQEQDGRATTTYVVNPQKLYALTEDLRRLSTQFAGAGTADATGTLARAPEGGKVAGPCLVLVHGVYEGKVFPLGGRADRWVIGRKREVAVQLDYDPYVSLENSAVVRQGGQWAVTDLPGSKNGTAVNWVPLARGGTRPLKAGDNIGVGRSILTFVPQ